MVDLQNMANQALRIAEKRAENGAKIDVGTLPMLKHCATEVVEATDAYGTSLIVNTLSAKDDDVKLRSELADIIMCVLIISANENINIEDALAECMEKNRKRAEGQGDKL